MSDYSSTATTTLYVNGKPAEQEIKRLRAELDGYKKQLMEIASDPSKGLGSKEWVAVQKKIKDTTKELDKAQSAVANVTQAVRRLDKATPEELRKSLRQLNKELASIERGSKAWDEQTKKIKAVRTELAKIKAETKEHTSLWDRFAKKMFDWGAAIQTVMASITGITMTARQAVNAYAQMEQEEANVRKYTGMTADEVARLNEEFKKMDTRSSREQLNQLAQEAGRLGMQTQEDVLGFVRAADQINVALDELGEGATLTLSKLTDIFGDKQRLGVEKSLLSVGSVINELSQNCTASAPYLAEFASRMGGVGAQAGMTIQQIMAFAAVLDSNNQKVEASATAVSQVITRLYQDPAKYARVAGLDIQRFSELVRTDANEALLTLLQTLNQAGGMEKLAPMFKDMGENGARAISALSTLAKHIDDVRAQQLAANQAFEEGTSVTKEFNVQNNTVQAGLDKAKKSFNEIAIELGQKLAPVMKYAITSGSALMKGISGTITFVSEHNQALFNLVITIAAYTVATKASTIATALHTAAINISKAAIAGWNVVVKAGTVLQNAWTYAVGLAKVAQIAFTEGTVKARFAFAALNATMKANIFALILTAVTAVALAINNFRKKTEEATKAQKELAKLQDEIAESNKKHMEQLDLEKRKVQDLLEVARDEYAAKEYRIKAINKLNELIPGYCAQLNAETGAYEENKAALDRYLESLEKKIRLEANKEEYERLIKEDEQINRQLYEDEQNTRRVARRIVGRGKSRQAQEEIANRMGVSVDVGGNVSDVSGLTNNQRRELQGRQKWVQQRIQDLYDYAGKANLVTQSGGEDTPEDFGSPGGAGGAGGSGSGRGSTGQADKLAKEKAIREQAIAVAKIAWLKGEVDYEQHMSNLEAIELAYYEAVLEHQDLSDQELLDNQVKYLEEKQKQEKRANAQSIEEENRNYAERQALIQQDYLQNLIGKEAYDMQMQRAEMEHLYAMTQLTKEGTDEREKAEAAYRQKLVAEQQKRQQEYERKEKEHQDELKRIKDEYFGNNAAENKALYDAALANLQQVYNAELAAAGDNAKEKLRIEKAFLAAKAALRKKFNQDDQTENMNFLQAWGQSVNEWLESDMGKAVTGTMEMVTNAMSSLFSQMSTLIQAESEIQIAAIERRYETEVSRAEGNKAKVNAIEKRKEKETAKVKNEAARKQMSMQVIQAIAQTASAALNAYSSAAAVPVIGYILAPIAAAMAVAAGMMQVAAIKKQQQAQEAQGYAQGGFTPAGPKDKPVGIVHAGEWVASQELLANPVARPAINALDYAQRHNTIGSLRATDVSRSVTANQVVARVAAEDNGMTVMAASVAAYADTMRQLRERLNEPFVTVNTIEGDTGIKQAQDEYQRLMNNTLPKSKRK